LGELDKLQSRLIEDEGILRHPEEWIAKWSNNETCSIIPHKALEILVLHKMVDIAYLLVDGPEQCQVTAVVPVAHHDMHVSFIKKICAEDSKWTVSSVLKMLKDKISSLINSFSSSTQHGGANSPPWKKLARSAMAHMATAEGETALFNVEITAALLHYILVEVWTQTTF
jgi:hypothetical protein